MWWAALAALVAAAVVALVIVVLNKPDRTTAAPGSSTTNPPPAAGLPPWPAPSDATAAADKAGLPMLSAEGMAEHIHTHLDVSADGQPVSVPASIGIDTARGSISPLHTHDDSGVIHIESPVKRDFTLGQFFTEWGVSLSADNIGGLRATDGKSVRTYVNGQLRTGDPATIVLKQHDEIALVYGQPNPGESVPATFVFPPGD